MQDTFDIDRAERLGAEIRRRRRAQGITSARMASMVGTSAGQLWRVEAGKTNVTLALLCRIADALGVSVRDLICF